MPTRQDLHISQGATWSFTWTKTSGGSAVDLTGYSARMAIKRCVGGGTEAYLSNGADADGGTITLGGALGTVVLSMTAEESSAFGGSRPLPFDLDDCDPCDLRAWATDEYRYDLELVSPGGTVTRELEGRVHLSREITAP